MRKLVSFNVENAISFKEKLLHWAGNFSRCCVLDSSSEFKIQNSEFSNNHYNCIAGIDSVSEIIPAEKSFDALKKFQKEKRDWLFGFLSYDLSAKMDGLRFSAEKSEIEPPALFSPNEESRKEEGGIRFPLLHFFQPKYVFILKGNKLEIGFLPEVSSEEEVKTVFQKNFSLNPLLNTQHSIPNISKRISMQEYIRTANKIKKHIHRGDIYEMNYCMEFFSECTEIIPEEIFKRLNETSLSPFSAFYRMNDNYLMCASPERFLKKSGRKIISQPMKGTSGRGADFTEDEMRKEELSKNQKEQSENVMIVDLVRNDLSKTCNQVKADELFGVYTFRQWHQMISTVSGVMRENIHFADVIKNAFPMGSMTGAPKIRAMEIIEQYEKTKRGLYSGAVGYITPDSDFDFNVVIRSILYNSSTKYLSFHVGSAITANSIPENEYDECLLKAKGMFEALKAHPQPLPMGGEHEVEKSESVF